MIDTVFGFGTSKTPDDDAFVGGAIADEMRIGLVLLVIVVILIPIMLFAKPCCFRGDPGHEDEGEVEFANI